MGQTNSSQEGTTANELYILALRYYEGNGVARNEKTALKWFSMSARQGYPPAQIELGDFYCYGLVVKQNIGKAIALYKKAAGQGEKRAFSRLGYAYADGMEDYKESAKWYRKAARQGEWFACYRIGTFYRDGKGVKQSDKEADKWFGKARKLNPSL